MAEEQEKVVTKQRGVIIEFDFAVLPGAELLYREAKKYLGACNIELTPKVEAIHLAGGNYQGALNELFTAYKNKHDAAKAAREISEAFIKALSGVAVQSVTADTKAFVKALLDKDVQVVIATRTPLEPLKGVFADVATEKLKFYEETASTYGNCKWDAWQRTCASVGLFEVLTVAVTGSGFGVRAALVGGLSAIAVTNPHVAYQDFGGADAVVEKLDAAAAEEVCRMLKIA